MKLLVVCLGIFAAAFAAPSLREVEVEVRNIVKRSPAEYFGSEFCSKFPQHSACVSKESPSKSGISEAEKAQILEKHNYLRSTVDKVGQPKPSNMQKMYWDDNIAYIAQRYADHCVYEHDQNSNRGIPGVISAGQNLAQGYGSWPAAVDGWYSEHSSFTYGQGKTGSDDIGHYTQLVWATSTHLGCGFAVCNGKTLYVCNYGPAGNSGGMLKPYETGTPQCDNADNLCDCSGKTCGSGTLNVKTCQCKCPDGDWYKADTCALDCSKATTDKWFCASAGGNWDVSYCKKYSNVPNDCPNMCGVCKNGQNLAPVVDGINKGIDGTPKNIAGSTGNTNTNVVITTNVITGSAGKDATDSSGYPVSAFTTQNTDIKMSNGVCAVPDMAKCNSYDSTDYNMISPEKGCECRFVVKDCPAMCKKCKAPACYNDKRAKVNFGVTWENSVGRFKCTESGTQILEKKNVAFYWT